METPRAKLQKLQKLLKTYLEKYPDGKRELAKEFNTAAGTITRWANGFSHPPPKAQQLIIVNLKRKRQAG